MSISYYRPIYFRAALFALAAGMSGPFLTLYAIYLGADPLELGLLQAAINVIPNVFQLPFGRLVDRFGKRKLILYLGSIVYFSIFIPILFVSVPKQYVLLLSIQSIANAMITPAYLSLVGEMTTIENRASTMAKLNLLNGVGNLISTTFTSFFVYMYFGNSKIGYQFIFLSSLFFGILAIVSTHFIHEPKVKVVRETLNPIKDLLKILKGNRTFSTFLLLTLMYGFFMSLMWPLAGLTLAKVHNAGVLEFGLVQFFSMIGYIFAQNMFRRIFDQVGRVPMLVLARFGLIIFPLSYAFSPNMTYIYLASFLGSIFSALTDTAVLAYLFDTTPSGQRGFYTSLYNLMAGVSYFAGSIIGGGLYSLATPIFGIGASLQYVYLISIFGRGAFAFMHQKLVETRKVQTTLTKALLKELHIK
ncbi:MAG: MFS transporter [Nitrososphaeria archaeon]|nr:MFS transporter [Nitrososphaeria archaeon]